MRRIGSRAMLVYLVAVGVAVPALAVDGVIEINQAKALAGSVTAGDNPGLPVFINESGSYRLTSDLVPPPGIGAINIMSPNVTLDLNGFSILGKARDHGRQHKLQRDEGYIHRRDRGHERQHPDFEIARVGPLDDVDPRVVPQGPVELPAADVESDDTGGLAREENVREPAGGGADVERVAARGRDAETIEHRVEFQPPTAYEVLARTQLQSGLPIQS